MAKCKAEVDAQLAPLGNERSAYSITEVEASLPYLRQCIKENFRITPVFTMPLARRVLDPAGVVIGGRHIPQGVRATGAPLCHMPSSLTSSQTSIAVCNHAFHHNPAVWGEDHNTFDPSRWDKPETAARARYLMHFGLGGRQCIGKTVAQTNIYKLSSTLLREFEFELAGASGGVADVEKGNRTGKQLPELVSVGISDLQHPLMVRAKKRTTG